MTPTFRSQAAPIVALIVIGGIFGSAFLYVKVLVDAISPLQIAASRLAIAAFSVWALVALRGSMPRFSRAMLGGIVVIALLDGVIPYTAIAWAQQHIDSGMASVLVSTMPLFTALIAASLGTEGLSARTCAGIAVGFAGVAVLTGDGGSIASGLHAGHLAVIGAAASYAAAAVLLRRMLAHSDVVELLAVKLTFGAAIAATVALPVDGVSTHGAWGWHETAALVALGVFSTGLVRIGYFRIIAAVGSVRASLVTYIVPVAGVTLGWAVLGEELSSSMFAGGALIVAGVATVMYGGAIARMVPRLIASPETRWVTPAGSPC